MDYMIFFREKDQQHFLFNGKWIINIDTRCQLPWGADDEQTPTEIQIERTEKDVTDLLPLLTNKSRTFTLRKLKYRIISRGKFIIDD